MTGVLPLAELRADLEGLLLVLLWLLSLLLGHTEQQDRKAASVPERVEGSSGLRSSTSLATAGRSA